jgi:hypothetical protein
MRLLGVFIFIAVFFVACQKPTQQEGKNSSFLKADTTDRTNDFYDNAPTHPLKTPGEIQVHGEVMETVNIDFNELPLRSVIVKETLLHTNTDSFVGAYQYHGYSLYDILNQVVIEKANKEEFSPIIDLYIEIEGAAGERTVLSWGEIFYPVNRHLAIIATRVTPIVPSKTKDMWPLPQNSRLVVGTDLFTHRNISSPVKISIRSLKAQYEVNREMDKLYAPSVKLIDKRGRKLTAMQSIPDYLNLHAYPTTFYGRGRGIHGITTFRGFLFKELLEEYYPVSAENIQTGMFTVAAADGYRAAFTYAEIMNRNDQSETLLIDMGEGEDKGRFRLFHSADFFSDRAIKAVSEVDLNALGVN